MSESDSDSVIESPVYLLDTNCCIRFLNGRAPIVRERLRLRKPHEIAVCSVVKAEMFAGALKSLDPARSLARQQRFLSRFVSLPFDDQAAEACGRIRSQLEQAGTPIGPYDLQIAAIAISNRLSLITHNVREFSRIEGLQWEDWDLK